MGEIRQKRGQLGGFVTVCPDGSLDSASTDQLISDGIEVKSFSSSLIGPNNLKKRSDSLGKKENVVVWVKLCSENG